MQWQETNFCYLPYAKQYKFEYWDVVIFHDEKKNITQCFYNGFMTFKVGWGPTVVLSVAQTSPDYKSI